MSQRAQALPYERQEREWKEHEGEDKEDDDDRGKDPPCLRNRRDKDHEHADHGLQDELCRRREDKPQHEEEEEAAADERRARHRPHTGEIRCARGRQYLLDGGIAPAIRLGFSLFEEEPAEPAGERDKEEEEEKQRDAHAREGGGGE